MLRTLESIPDHRQHRFVSHAGAFLPEIAERGFGIPARHLLRQNETYFIEDFTMRLGVLLDHPLVHPQMAPTALDLLYPIQINKQKITVDLGTAKALLELLHLKDQMGSVEWIGCSGPYPWSQPVWLPFLEEDKPFFLALLGLELAGVVTGIQESYIQTGGENLRMQRVFKIDREALSSTGRSWNDIEGQLSTERWINFPTMPPGIT